MSMMDKMLCMCTARPKNEALPCCRTRCSEINLEYCPTPGCPPCCDFEDSPQGVCMAPTGACPTEVVPGEWEACLFDESLEAPVWVWEHTGSPVACNWSWLPTTDCSASDISCGSDGYWAFEVSYKGGNCKYSMQALRTDRSPAAVGAYELDVENSASCCPLYAYIYECCATACELYCQASCEVSCQTGCETSCETGCETSCETGCETGCTTGCEVSCEIGCETTCVTGCETSCQTSCETGCEVQCQTECQITCQP